MSCEHRDNAAAPVMNVIQLYRWGSARVATPKQTYGQLQVYWVCPACGTENVEMDRNNGGTFECFGCEETIQVDVVR